MGSYVRKKSLSGRRSVVLLVCLLASPSDKLSAESSCVDSASPARRRQENRLISASSASGQASIINEGNCGITAWQDRWSDC